MCESAESFGSHRLVHLDLKGCPLKIGFLEKLLPAIREWGATGILIEWEDTFPYSGHLAAIGSKNIHSNAYSEEEVLKIVGLAEEIGLKVIPLVQTFGHLEYVLKHAEWKRLREVSNYPSSICPSNPDSLELVTAMLDQVLRLTPSKEVHIGADEVWHMRFCERCHPIAKERLFLTHVMNVVKYLRQNHPDVRPIMWDDMLRPIDVNTLKEFGIGEYVEPMVWHYQPADSFSIPEGLWTKYGEVFTSIWVASAFKGSTGSSQLLPDLRHHISNHQAWLTTLERNGHLFKSVRGIALTGWSRYDHYATLCELLPVALPSLAVCLRTWLNRGCDQNLYESVAVQLGYVGQSFSTTPRWQHLGSELKYPGWRLAIGVEKLEHLRAKHKSVVESNQVATWLNSWQIKNNFTNPMQVEGLLRAFNELNTKWDALESYLRQHMPEVYYDAAIKEWTETLIEPLRNNLNSILEDAQSQIKRNS